VDVRVDAAGEDEVAVDVEHAVGRQRRVRVRQV
jgi:hypothetical protein